MKIQRMYPEILMIAQQPVEVVFIGSYSLSRNTFKKMSDFQATLQISNFDWNKLEEYLSFYRLFIPATHGL